MRTLAVLCVYAVVASVTLAHAVEGLPLALELAGGERWTGNGERGTWKGEHGPGTGDWAQATVTNPTRAQD